LGVEEDNGELNSKGKIENIAKDVKVLSDKCNRDVDRKFYLNYEYYLKELNRIMVELKQIQPKMFQDIDLLEDAKNKLSGASVTGEQAAKLYEISAVTDKLLSRLHQTIDTELPQGSTARNEGNSISDDLTPILVPPAS